MDGLAELGQSEEDWILADVMAGDRRIAAKSSIIFENREGRHVQVTRPASIDFSYVGHISGDAYTLVEVDSSFYGFRRLFTSLGPGNSVYRLSGRRPYRKYTSNSGNFHWLLLPF